MMAMASEVAIFERPELQDDIRPLYAETLSLVERLHRAGRIAEVPRQLVHARIDVAARARGDAESA